MEELQVWIQSTVVAFMVSCRSFGTSQESANRFLESHRDLVNQIHMKSFELEGLKGALKTVSDQCSNEDTKNVERKMDEISKNLCEMNKKINCRLEIAEKFVKFLKLSSELEKELLNVERNFNEESRLLIQQLSVQFLSLAKITQLDIEQLDDQHLDKKSTVNFIITNTEKLNKKQFEVIEKWKNLESNLREGKKVEEEWIRLDREKRESVAFSLDVDHELYPILPQDLGNPDWITSNLEERILKLPKQKIITEKFHHLISKVEQILPKLPQDKRKEAILTVEDLKQKLKFLQVLFSDYELILQMLIPLFKNYGEVHKTMGNLIQQYNQGQVPNDVTEAEFMAREHEAGKGSLLEIIKFAKTERNSILSKIDTIKSKSLLKQDHETLNKMFENFESEFEISWQQRKKSLTKHAKFCLFMSGLKKFSEQLHEIHETVKLKTNSNDVRGMANYLDSLTKILKVKSIYLCGKFSTKIKISHFF